jgi:hypothetical protein
MRRKKYYYVNVNTVSSIQSRMTDNEIKTLKDYLLSSRHYIEYGVGGSTLLAAECKNILSINSVDSDKDWCDFIKNHRSDSRMNIIHVNIGKTKQWGYPKDESDKHLWIRYPLSIDQQSLNNANLALIDGRFRVACALFCAKSMKPGSIIMVHDYKQRPHYHILQNELTLIKMVDSMAIFEVPMHLISDLCEYFMDPR